MTCWRIRVKNAKEAYSNRQASTKPNCESIKKPRRIAWTTGHDRLQLVGKPGRQMVRLVGQQLALLYWRDVVRGQLKIKPPPFPVLSKETYGFNASIDPSI